MISSRTSSETLRRRRGELLAAGALRRDGFRAVVDRRSPTTRYRAVGRSAAGSSSVAGRRRAVPAGAPRRGAGVLRVRPEPAATPAVLSAAGSPGGRSPPRACAAALRAARPSSHRPSTRCAGVPPLFEVRPFAPPVEPRPGCSWRDDRDGWARRRAAVTGRRHRRSVPVATRGPGRDERPRALPRGVLRRRSTENPGGDLLSQGVSPQVPSARAVFTSVFGMGTGVSPPQLPPETSAVAGNPGAIVKRSIR